MLAKSNLPKKVVKELVRLGSYTKEELEYSDEQTCWSSAKKKLSCQSATQDDDASKDDGSNDRRKRSCWNSSIKNTIKALKLRSKVQGRLYAQ